MATYYNNLQPQEKLNLIQEILSIYRYFPKNLLFDLVSATNEVGGVSFVNIKGYCSDASNNSEIADQLINIGASYENMIAKDANKYANCDYNKFCALVDSFNLQYINTNGKSEVEFKKEVKANFQAVLTDLLTPKPQSEKVDNFIHFNKVLAYNRNTKNLSIFGMQVTKNVIVKAETDYKIVKSAPATITRQLIQKCVDSRTATLRRFNIGNITKQLNIVGNQIEIG